MIFFSMDLRGYGVRWLSAVSALFFAMAAAAPIKAQETDLFRDLGETQEKYQVMVFDKSDFVRQQLGDFKKSCYVGEPLAVPLILANHTKHTITIQTNMNPQSMLTVMVQKRGEPPRQIGGPYEVGNFSPGDYILTSFEEITLDALLWSDREAPGGLVFSEPGEYTVSMTLKIHIPNANLDGSLPFAPFTVKVNPTPEDLKPMIEKLRSLKAFTMLEKREITSEMLGQFEGLLREYAETPSAITPYMALCVGRARRYAWTQDPENSQMFDDAVNYFTVAAHSDSAFQLDAYGYLIQTLDEGGKTDDARRAALDYIKLANEKFGIGHAGDSPLVLKLLPQAREFTRSLCWTLFP